MTEQKYKNIPYAFGLHLMIVLLAFLNAFVPLSIDLYLPALPGLAEHFGADPSMVNLTLICFMLLFALSMLAWGPFSDKYGRRPILTAGLILYIAGSVLCALSFSLWMLIAGRCVQALGSGAVIAVTLAIVKDTFHGHLMEMVLTAMQTMSVIAPMVAPVLGGLLLAFTSWRGIFWVLAACGGMALLGSLFLRETMTGATQGSALHALTRIGYVLRHFRFSSLLTVFALSIMPFMAFLAVSAYVYQGYYGLSAQQYSLCFTANACFCLLGPLMYAKVLHRYNKRLFISCCFAALAVSGVMLLLFGAVSPWLFSFFYFFISFAGSGVRPYATVLMMSQLDSDNGSVSALIGSTNQLFGSIAMLMCGALPWPSFIVASGTISLLAGLICFVSWQYLNVRKLFRNAV